MKRFAVLALLSFELTGCQPQRLGPYTSPRVTGRVLDADTHEALAAVTVRRNHTERRLNAGDAPKGAEFLLQQPAVRTGHDGRFNFQSERALTIFRPAGWNLVELSFERAGYERFQTNFSILAAGTNSPTDEPLLETGDVLMQRAK